MNTEWKNKLTIGTKIFRWLGFVTIMIMATFLLLGWLFNYIDFSSPLDWKIRKGAESLNSGVVLSLGVGTILSATVGIVTNKAETERKLREENRSEILALQQDRYVRQRRREERINKSLDLLGEDSIDHKIAGLNALAALSDEFVDEFKRERENGTLTESEVEVLNQRIVDMLTTFLRLAGLLGAGLHLPSDDGINDGHSTDFPERALGIAQERVITLIAERTQGNEKLADWRNLRFSMQDTIFHCSVNIEKCEFKNELTLFRAKFRHSVYASHAQFNIINLNGASFEDRAIFEHAHFSNPSFEGNVNFAKKANFRGAHFGNEVGESTSKSINWGFVASDEVDNYPGTTRFKGSVDFRRSKWFWTPLFNETEFSGKVLFDNATFCDSAIFSGCNFHGDISFNASSYGRALELHKCTVLDKKEAHLDSLQIGDSLKINHCDFKSHFYIRYIAGIDEKNPHFRRFELFGVSITGSGHFDGFNPQLIEQVIIANLKVKGEQIGFKFKTN
ncbi:pentapeptide repeat-containing protein [Arcanobacterium phocae]|uniref:pentapeptide repeat-containing protein n=1 Tax=Arcanobacterium phocae TaxID=131112 RepID=UPI00155F585E|nr:pentapeptide repeat-containing protein [Arcanobacterium phocae]